ncbi:MAG: 4'-phosphopantetheinyl transferase superfamily protein [Candidatus Krumholzibacteriota bacterium]|nr:4'-phosphopantetheinyl transferase superfamily protein [Candidatus Krumholzibacteriota bacterium]
MDHAQKWITASKAPPLNENTVHLWRMGLDLPRKEIADLRKILSEKENSRANRFHFPEAGEAFIVTHAVLRRILADYTGLQPAEIKFNYGPHGKPGLDLAGGPCPVQFNLSHSGRMALWGFTRERRIGVDVERLRDNYAGSRIEKRIFSEKELREFNRLPSKSKNAFLFHRWTGKEAYLKATGRGLSFPPAEVELPLKFTGGGEPIILPDPGSKGGAWSLLGLDLGDAYAGALAVEDRCRSINFFIYDFKSLVSG